jgi:hypothetical protein
MPLPYATPARVKTRLGITSTDKDTLLYGLCEEVNSYIEQVTRRAVGSSSVSGQLIDGWGQHIQDGGYIIDYPQGIRNIHSLEIKLTTDGDYTSIGSNDRFIRPEDAFRSPGWPGFYIALTDIGSVTAVQGAFGAVRLSADIGWSQMPSDLRGTAEVAVSRALVSKTAGYKDDVGADEFGEITVSRFLSSHDYRTIRRYRWEVVEII